MTHLWQRWRSARAKRSRLAGFAIYLAALELLLIVIQFGFHVSAGAYLIGFALLVCLLGLGLRWFRRVAMWRLRWRLLITYIFIGLIPVGLLLKIGLVAAYLFAGQFATFIVTSDLRAELKSLESVNRIAAGILADQVAAGMPLEKAIRGIRLDSPERRITVWTMSPDGTPVAYVQPPDSTVVSLPPKSQPASASAIAGEETTTHLRAWTNVTAGNTEMTVVASEPLDQDLLARIANGVGEVSFNPLDFGAQGKVAVPDTNDVNLSLGQKRSDLQIKDGRIYARFPNSKQWVATLPEIKGGPLAPARSRWDHEVVFPVLCQVMDWQRGERTPTLLVVSTRPSLLYGRLFMALGEFAGLIIIVLAIIAVIFALIELAALIIAIRITRTITGSVAELYGATEHVNRGDLAYRIKVTGQDQLANLETSFNSMSASLERLIAEQKEKQRMESELAIAQEVQAQLFPSELSQLATLEVHGFCRPARTVSGDYYDFLMLGAEKLGLAVGDISGKGISAALLMATIHSAVRVYEFGRMPSPERLLAAGAAAHVAAGGDGYAFAAASAIQSPASVLELLNRHVYHSTPPEKYATLFLALWDGGARQLTYSNGGHLPPLVVSTDGTVRRLEAGGTVIGLFDQMQWNEATVDFAPGDLFVAYSDGITEPENEFGEFGEARLTELIEKNRNLPLARITEAVIASVTEWMGAGEQPDDLTLVLARAK